MSISFSAHVLPMFITVLLIVLGCIVIIIVCAVTQRCKRAKRLRMGASECIPPPVVDEVGEDWKRRLVEAVDRQHSNSKELQELLKLWLEEVARIKRENARKSHVTKGF